MAVTADKAAPYATTKTVLDLIERYRNRGLPSPVDKDVLARAGVSDSLVPRTLQALESLDLIDEAGAPTRTFEVIRLAPETEYKKCLADWLKATYADVFAFVDPTKDGEIRIRDAFRSYQPVGQQARMVTLFIGLCTAAGLMTEKPVADAPNLPRARAGTAMSAVRRAISKESKDSARHDSRQNHGGSGASGLPAPLAGLLASLPSPTGTGWTQSKRDKFVETFQHVLDFCFPIVSESRGVNNESDDEAA